jgi:hypothetical protein
VKRHHVPYVGDLIQIGGIRSPMLVTRCDKHPGTCLWTIDGFQDGIFQRHVAVSVKNIRGVQIDAGHGKI